MLFLYSYAPLYVVAGIKLIDLSGFPSELWGKDTLTICLEIAFPILLFLLACVIFCAATWWLRRLEKRSSVDVITLKSVQLEETKYTGYIATYILPFIGLQAADWGDVFSGLAVFLVAGYVYAHSNLVFTNPTLLFQGYKLWKGVSNKNKEYILLAYEKPQLDTGLKGELVGGEVILIQTKK